MAGGAGRPQARGESASAGVVTPALGGRRAGAAGGYWAAPRRAERRAAGGWAANRRPGGGHAADVRSLVGRRRDNGLAAGWRAGAVGGSRRAGGALVGGQPVDGQPVIGERTAKRWSANRYPAGRCDRRGLAPMLRRDPMQQLPAFAAAQLCGFVDDIASVDDMLVDVLEPSTPRRLWPEASRAQRARAAHPRTDGRSSAAWGLRGR